MKEVSYIPYSPDLTHPGDRRRIKIWSDIYGIPLKTHGIKSEDILVVNGAGDFAERIKRHRGPLILDLVDGYLSYEPRFLEDFSRNLIRSFAGSSEVRFGTYTNFLRFLASRCDAVIVSSPEQEESVRRFNPRVYSILDDHSELLQEPSREQSQSKKDSINIVWEGQGVTLKHLTTISQELDDFICETKSKLFVVTEGKFKSIGNRFHAIDARKILDKSFPKAGAAVEFVPWSVENLISVANQSDLAIIPINTSDRFAYSKPENKLLSFWSLGLPVMCSPTPAYSRVIRDADAMGFLIQANDWCFSLTHAMERIQAGFGFGANERMYLKKNHTKEILARKWQEVFEALR